MGIQADRISKVVGYKLSTFIQDIPLNLPMRIAILGQGNADNETEYDAHEKKEFITAQKAGQRYGYGSPVYNIMRILRPPGGGVGGIQTFVFPQKAADGAATKVLDITPTGTATGNATHTLIVSGRAGVDGDRYDFNVETGDDVAAVSEKISNALNSVLASPVAGATVGTPATKATATSKWAGADANDINIEIDVNDRPVGMSYAVAEDQAASGVPAIADSLAAFEDEWFTIVINPYTDAASLDALEAFNGRPDDENPTGRYSANVFKPFVALFGDVTPNADVDVSGRAAEVTNVFCPAPNAKVTRAEVAAAYGRLLATQAHDRPHTDISGRHLPMIPAAQSAGEYADYNFRDQTVRAGKSTAVISAAQYEIKDFVTTYHPDGEVPLQFNFVRNLVLDWNIRFGYFLLEEANVVDHVIADDGDTVDAERVIKPKTWKQIVGSYAEQLGRRAIIADVEFMQESIDTSISQVNPDRIQTKFRYKRTGYGRISSTEAKAGFNLGE